MAITTNSNLTGAQGAIQFPRYNIDWKLFGVTGKTSDTVILTGVDSPLDAKNKIRYQFGRINNIYNGTDIASTLQVPNREGASLLIQTTSAVSVEESTDSRYRVLLPMSAHLVLKFARNNLVTPDHIVKVLRQLLGSMFAHDSDGSTPLDTGQIGLARLMRGSIDPTSWPETD